MPGEWNVDGRLREIGETAWAECPPGNYGCHRCHASEHHGLRRVCASIKPASGTGKADSKGGGGVEKGQRLRDQQSV